MPKRITIEDKSYVNNENDKNEKSFTPIYSTDYDYKRTNINSDDNSSPEKVNECVGEELIEKHPLDVCLSRTNSHSRPKSHTCGGPPRPSLISHHKMSFAVEGDYYDRTDSLPLEMSFTYLDAAAILFSIGSFLFDIGTDVAVATFHCMNKDYWYFSLTLAFVVLPTIIMTGISMRWYVLDSREEGSPSTSCCQWFTRLVFLLLQLGPILRYFDSLMYGLKFRQHRDKETQKKYFQYMIYEDTDATMLRLFECFMEAAPQLVLQIYILAKTTPHEENDHWTVVAQVIAVVASLVSLSWSLVSYHRALRMSLPDKTNMTWQGIAIQFIWRFFSIASRVLSLALFASEFRFYISIVCGVHWLLMFFWIISMRTSFCDNKCEELGYNAVLAVMFIFCYFNPVDSPTRKRYAIYYTFMLCENIILMTLWYIWCDEDKWYRDVAMFGYFVSFFTGLAFMAVYYLKLHPSGNIVFWRSEQEEEDIVNQSLRRRGGYKRQIQNGLWTTQGRLLHPRPAVPTTLSDSKLKQISNNGNSKTNSEKQVFNSANV